MQSLQSWNNWLKISRLYVNCVFCDISVLKGFIVNNQVLMCNFVTLQLQSCVYGFNFANFVNAWCNSGCFLRYRLFEGCWVLNVIRYYRLVCKLWIMDWWLRSISVFYELNNRLRKFRKWGMKRFVFMCNNCCWDI